jgi:4-hydroxyphenylpyruvate dioxygenase-like putative hemolysin
VAPFVTALPVADVWVTAAVAREELHEAAQADAVSEGPNIAFLQAEGDGPLTFRERHSELWIADRFRLYLDLRRDPRRGREQADHLRQEVIGF